MVRPAMSVTIVTSVFGYFGDGILEVCEARPLLVRPHDLMPQRMRFLGIARYIFHFASSGNTCLHLKYLLSAPITCVDVVILILMSLKSSRLSVITEPKYLKGSVNSTCPSSTAMGPVSGEFGLFGSSVKYTMHSYLDLLFPLPRSIVYAFAVQIWQNKCRSFIISIPVTRSSLDVKRMAPSSTYKK
eukprot:scaffold23973_cov58-Attheya_sp.AAC.2